MTRKLQLTSSTTVIPRRHHLYCENNRENTYTGQRNRLLYFTQLCMSIEETKLFLTRKKTDTVGSIIITQPTNALIVCHLFLNNFFKTLLLLLHVSIAYRLSSSGSTYSS